MILQSTWKSFSFKGNEVFILAKNPNPIKVPCHRVVMSDGKVGGYAYGTARKKDLLEKEGVFVTNGIINDFENVRVHP